MIFRFPVRITEVYELKTSKHVGGIGKDAVFSSDSAGWYARINDHLSIYLGPTRPDIEGDYELILQPRSHK